MTLKRKLKMDKPDEIERIIRNSNKAELIEKLSQALEVDDPKVIVVIINDKEEGQYSSDVITLGLNNTYEAYGMLEVAKRDLMEDDY
jgi:hypothetical protein